MAIKKSTPIVDTDFIGVPYGVTAKKGVEAVDINTFTLYRQDTFPQGDDWIPVEQIVIPTTDFISEGTTNKYGATEFIQLEDVPSSYAGESLKLVRVNAAETGLEFFTLAGAGITDLNGLNAAVQTFSKVDDTNMSLTITSAVADHEFALSWVGTLADGRISSAATWNAKQDAISLTTIGTSGAATFIANTLNIPDYSGAFSGFVPYTGATANLDMGIFSVDATSVHVHTSIDLGDTSHTEHLRLRSNEDLTADATLNIVVNDATRSLTIAGNTTISGTNTGDQTSIVGISGTMAQFDTACSDGNFVYESDLGAGIATWLATPSSANLAAAITDETGTAGALVFSTSPVFTTPRLASTSTAGHIWTATDALGNGSFQAATGGGANTALSNLAAVAINTSLISDTDVTDDLGSPAINWLNVYAAIFNIDNTVTMLMNGTELEIDGATAYGFGSTIKPLTNNNVALGVATTGEFSDLFLGEGGTINWDNGDAVMTQTGNDISFTGITTFGLGTSTALTTGTIELGALTDTTLARVSAGLISVEGKTVLTNTTTAGVGTSPTASQTDTITHGLGRVPTIIRIYGYGTFTSSTSATPTTSSMGIFNSSGNFCVYQKFNNASITTTQAGLSSNTFAILLATGANNFISGVIQNVTSTQFDIVWTETGTATAQVYLWECQ